jgi:hypothetical protein
MRPQVDCDASSGNVSGFISSLLTFSHSHVKDSRDADVDLLHPVAMKQKTANKSENTISVELSRSVKCVELHQIAECNYVISRESDHRIIKDLREIQAIGGGSRTDKQFSKQQASISRFGIIITDFHRKKIVGLGAKYIADEICDGILARVWSRIWVSATVELVVKKCFDGFTLLQSIIFENGSKLNRIEESAFYQSGLKSIVIPSSVEIFGRSCFQECKSLKSVSFENESKLSCIEEFAFSESGLKSIVIPSSVGIISKSCFQECKSLESVSFENESKLIRIEQFAFSESGLKSIVIPSSVEILCKSCFERCKFLESVLFENESKLIRIEQFAFSGSGLKSIVIPKSIEVICRASLHYLTRFLSIQNTK